MRDLLRTASALVLCGTLASACAAIQDDEELPFTTWQVVEIDGDEVSSGEVLLFLDANTATLLTQPMLGNRNVGRHCAESTSEMVWDADGRALNFTGFEDEGSRVLCGPGMEELHVRISIALRDNESWEATSEWLDLVGSSRVRLESTGSD